MRPVFLHLDDALLDQPALLAEGRAAGGIEIDARALGPRLRLWSRPDALRKLGAALDAGGWPDRPALAFYGSGDFHHVSAVLIARAAAQAGEPVTVVHVDNHPDWVRFRNGLHCGSWASSTARRAGIARVVTIGPTSDDIRQAWRKGADLPLVRAGAIEIYPYGDAETRTHRVAGVSRATIAGIGEEAFLDLLASRIETAAVYLTIDKDALAPADAATNWDQGRLGLSFVAALIARLAAGRRLIGADVCGDWSAPAYAGSLATRVRKRGEAWLDQPRGVPGAAQLAINQRTNRALLRHLSAVAA